MKLSGNNIWKNHVFHAAIIQSTIEKAQKERHSLRVFKEFRLGA
jgi:hypothetical protein